MARVLVESRLIARAVAEPMTRIVPPVGTVIVTLSRVAVGPVTVTAPTALVCTIGPEPLKSVGSTLSEHVPKVQPPSSRLVAEVVIPVMSPSALSSGSLGTFFQRVGQHGTPVVAEAHELDHFFELLPTFPWNLLVERLVYSLRSSWSFLKGRRPGRPAAD